MYECVCVCPSMSVCVFMRVGMCVCVRKCTCTICVHTLPTSCGSKDQHRLGRVADGCKHSGHTHSLSGEEMLILDRDRGKKKGISRIAILTHIQEHFKHSHTHMHIQMHIHVHTQVYTHPVYLTYMYIGMLVLLHACEHYLRTLTTQNILLVSLRKFIRICTTHSMHCENTSTQV